MSPPANATPATSADVRARLEEALRLDLVGPPANSSHPLAHEQLSEHDRPSTFYLTGFLAPSRARADTRREADEDADENEIPDGGNAEEKTEDRKAAKRGCPRSVRRLGSPRNKGSQGNPSSAAASSQPQASSARPSAASAAAML